jgi:uroporphyrinogen-III decarboxylase
VYFSSTAAAPLKALALGWMPFEFLVTLMVEELSRMERLFAKMHENNLALVKLQAKGPGPVFMDAAVTGLGMVSPHWIKNFYTPYSKQYHDILQAAGKLGVFHTSGEPILAIADEIAKSGVNLQYGIAVPPWGEAPLSEIRQAIGPKVALSGGLEPAFLSGATPAAAKARALQALQDMQGQNGFLLGTADDTPWETSPEVLAAVGEAAQEFAARAVA